MAAELGTIYVRVGVRLREFQKAMSKLESRISQAKAKLSGLEKVGNTFKNIGKSLSMHVTAPLTAMGGALSTMAVKSAYAADRLADLTEITGMSVEAIQKWQYVAVKAGVNTEAVMNAMEGLIQRMGRGAEGSSTFTSGLEELGMSMKDLASMSPEKTMDTLIHRLAEMQDKVKRNVIGYKLFGRAWQDIAPMFAFGAKGIEEAKEEAVKLGLVLSKNEINTLVKVRTSMDQMKKSMEVVFMKLTIAVAPIVKMLGDALLNAVKPLSKFAAWLDRIPAPLKKLVVFLGVALASIGPLTAGIGGLISALVSLQVTLAGVGITIQTFFGWLSAVVVAIGLVTVYWKQLVGALSWGVGEILRGIAFAMKGLTLLARGFDNLTFKNTKLADSFEKTRLEIAQLGNSLVKYAEDVFTVKKATSSFDTKGATKSIKELSKEVKKLTGEAEGSVAAFDEVNQIGKTAGGFQINIGGEGLDKLPDITDNMLKLETASKGVSVQFGALGNNIDWISGELLEMEPAAEGVSTALVGAKSSVALLNTSLDELDTAVESATDNVTVMNNSFDSLSGTIPTTIDAFRNLDSGMGSVENTAKNVKTTMEAMKEATENVVEPLNNVKNATEDTSINLEDLTTTTEEAVPVMNDIKNVTDDTSTKMDELKNATEQATEPLKNIEDASNKAKNKLKDMKESVKDTTDVLKDLEDNTTMTADAIDTSLNTMAENIKSNIGETADDVKSDWDNLLGDMELRTTTFSDETDAAFEALGVGIEDHFSNLYDVLVGGSIVPDMVNEIIAWWEALSESTDENVQKIKGSFETGFSAIENKVKNTAKEINKSWNSAMEDMIEKTLNDYYPQFVTVMGAFGISSKDIARTIADAFKDAGRKITEELQSALEGTKSWSEAMKGIFVAFKGIIYQVAADLVAKMITSSLTGLATWLGEQLAAIGSAVIGWITDAYWSLVAWYSWMGPGAPAAAAATIGAAVITVGALATAGYSALQDLITGLATGGIVTAPTLAVLGEGGKKEAVVPLERDNVIARSVGDAVRNALSESQTTVSQSGEIILELDGYALGRAILPYLSDELVRTSVSLEG